MLTTCPDKEMAAKIANHLVEKRLAACVQLCPIESVYLWQGDICREDEITLVIKSKASLFDQVRTEIQAHHSYQVPEIIQVPITDGLTSYLRWIDDCVM